MQEEITQSNLKGFNRSSKIMEHKIGINEARILSTLIYKHNYWAGREDLVEVNGGEAFYITIPNLQVETNLGPKTIQRCLDNLKKSGLINVYRKGIPAQNYYVLNKEAIEGFDEKYESEYEEWANRINNYAESDRTRFENARDDKQKNVSVSQMESQIGQIVHTREVKMTDLDRTELPVTKNKNTKNNQLRISTNRINAEEKALDQLDELTEAIMDLRDSDDDNGESHKKLFLLMRDLVPRFEKFTESRDDSKLIGKINGYSLDPGEIAFKIVKNAIDIIKGIKEPRFGNLFVGLNELNENLELKYGT